jgi:hypothetical protein
MSSVSSLDRSSFLSLYLFSFVVATNGTSRLLCAGFEAPNLRYETFFFCYLDDYSFDRYIFGLATRYVFVVSTPQRFVLTCDGIAFTLPLLSGHDKCVLFRI